MKKILAVDDDMDFLEELGTALGVYDYSIFTDTDPVNALEQARQIKPDYILFDLKMPKVSGFQFLKALKNDDTLRQIPLVAMSGFYENEYDAHLPSLGVDKFLKKPFAPAEALNMFRPLLEGK